MLFVGVGELLEQVCKIIHFFIAKSVALQEASFDMDRCKKGKKNCMNTQQLRDSETVDTIFHKHWQNKKENLDVWKLFKAASLLKPNFLYQYDWL